MRLLHVVGARPNFMKMTPVLLAAERWNIDGEGDRAVAASDSPARQTSSVVFAQTLVHTGQHYDIELSDVFFGELGLPAPDHYLAVGSGSHAVQTARVLERVEPLLLEQRPDMVLVPGDVNSSMAVALACVKLHIPVAHLEAGLRSRDRDMPEEHNRVVIDHVADLLFTTCRDASDNLLHEGIPRNRICFVGNTMIDTLDSLLPTALAAEDAVRRRIGLDAAQAFALATLHRPSNVDDDRQLGLLLKALGAIARDVPVVFAVHPRTLARLRALGHVPERDSGFVVTPPLGYVDFLALMQAASVVLTDSGGVQEETTALNVPCVTLRTSTERPITLTEGSAVLADPTDPDAIVTAAVEGVRHRASGRPSRPEYWDGHAGERVISRLAHWLVDGH